MRRITAEQFDALVGDVLGVAARGFPNPQLGLGRSGYSTEPVANLVAETDAEEIMEATETVALVFTRDRLDASFPCASRADRPCAATIVRTLAPRLFRRPVSSEEQERLLQVFDGSGADFRVGVASLVQAMLLSPYFMFSPETEGPTAVGGTELTDAELGARLSMLLWRSTPDDELVAAIQRGELSDREGLAGQVRRMVRDPRSSRGLGTWGREWLMLRPLRSTLKDPQRFPGFTDAVAQSLGEEVERYVSHVFQTGGTLNDLVSGTETVVNRELARFYGVNGPTDEGWALASLPPERRGIFSRGAVLANLAHFNNPSHVLRGYVLRRRLLCEDFGAPPTDAQSAQPDYPESASARERSAILRQVNACSGCHNLIDPVGLAFERFDAAGQYRDVDELGTAIDTSGVVVGGGDLAGPIADAADLAQKLGESERVRTCVVRQFFRFTLGRIDDQPGDACLIEQALEQFQDAGLRLEDLVVAIATHPAFRIRTETSQ